MVRLKEQRLSECCKKIKIDMRRSLAGFIFYPENSPGFDLCLLLSKITALHRNKTGMFHLKFQGFGQACQIWS